MAGEYEHIRGKGNRFSSTNQPANRGRKPKLYTLAKKAYKISFEEWQDTALYLLESTKEEVKEIAAKPDTPIWVVTICNAILSDTKKGMMFSLNDVLDRLFGKARISAEVKATGGTTIVVRNEEEKKKIEDIGNLGV